MQISLFDSDATQGAVQDANKIELNGGKLIWYPSFFEQAQATEIQYQLKESLAWKHEAITLFGRNVMQPRLTAWYGSKSYRYSGLTLQPDPMTPCLELINQRLKNALNINFNSVLANLYRNGQDSMGYHQDNEPELGPNPIIASLSFGSTRKFSCRHLSGDDKFDIDLTHGSLLVMAGNFQTNWKHAIHKTKRHLNERINLTFRTVR